MKAVLDLSPDAARWTAGVGQNIVTSEHPEILPGPNTTSGILVSFESTGDYAELDLSASPVDVSDLTFLAFTVWSRSGYLKQSFSVTLDGADVQTFDVYDTITDIAVDISAVSTADRIRIELTSDLEQTTYLFLSYFVASYPEYPLDIMEGMVEHLAAERDRILPNGGFRAGTVTGSAGDTTVVISGLVEYVERYSVVTISGGGNTETHLLINRDGDEFTLGSMYDGETLLNNYASADVFVKFEVVFGQAEKEVLLPSVVIWGFEPLPVLRDNPNEDSILSSSGTGFSYLDQGLLLDFPMQIDIMARHYAEIARCADFVRAFMRHRQLWINGRKHDFIAEEPATEVPPQNPEVQIYQVTYNLSIEVRESGAARTYPASGAATITSNILP